MSLRRCPLEPLRVPTGGWRAWTASERKRLSSGGGMRPAMRSPSAIASVSRRATWRPVLALAVSTRGRRRSFSAPRQVLSMFVEQAYRSSGHGVSAGQRPFTGREKEVLGMLVAGCSNKEIAAPLGIEERTVKAHIAKLMRKVGVPNRVLLSVHAITHSLVASREC